jgi:hypothetical protein
MLVLTVQLDTLLSVHEAQMLGLCTLCVKDELVHTAACSFATKDLEAA